MSHHERGAITCLLAPGELARDTAEMRKIRRESSVFRGRRGNVGEKKKENRSRRGTEVRFIKIPS